MTSKQTKYRNDNNPDFPENKYMSHHTNYEASPQKDISNHKSLNTAKIHIKIVTPQFYRIN